MSTLINNATIKVRRDTSTNWTSNNPIPNQGEVCYETDTGNIKIGDGSTSWTSLVYYVPSHKNIEYDISTTDQTVTLPIPNNSPGILSYSWINGDGTAKLTFSVPDSSGVYTTSEYEGEGNGKIKWEVTQLSSGGYGWKVVDYEDSGSNSNGDWKKELDGTMTCMRHFNITVGASTNFTDSGSKTWAKEFKSIDKHFAGSTSNYGNAVSTATCLDLSLTTLGYNVRAINVFQSSNTAGYCSVFVKGIGTWK